MFKFSAEDREKRAKFSEFQKICEGIGFEPPKDIHSMDIFNHYSFSQTLKEYQMSFEEMKIISETTLLDKYYVDSLMMFPELYLCTNDNKSFEDLTDAEKVRFEIDAEATVRNVVENQRELFNSDVVFEMMNVHMSHIDAQTNNKTEDAQHNQDDVQQVTNDEPDHDEIEAPEL